MASIGCAKQDSFEIAKVTDSFSNLLHIAKSAHDLIFFDLDIKLTQICVYISAIGA
jgi:hypothetical protein